MWGKSTFHFEISESSQTSGQSTSKNVYVIVSKVNQIQHSWFRANYAAPTWCGTTIQNQFLFVDKAALLTQFCRLTRQSGVGNTRTKEATSTALSWFRIMPGCRSNSNESRLSTKLQPQKNHWLQKRCGSEVSAKKFRQMWSVIVIDNEGEKSNC